MGGESRGFMGMGGLNSQAAQGNSMASLSDYIRPLSEQVNQQMNQQMMAAMQQNAFLNQGLAAMSMAQSSQKSQAARDEVLTVKKLREAKEKLCRPDPQKYYYSDLAAAYLPMNPKPTDTIEKRLPLNIDRLRAEVRAWTKRAA